MNLTEWTYVLTFGYDLDVYAKGYQRVGIDRSTSKVVVSYIVQ